MSGNDGVGRGNRPVDTLRDGALKLAIFRNRREQGDSYSLVPGRIYTDEKTKKIRETSSLSGSEPLRMANLLNKGYERVAEYRERDKQERAHEGDDRGASRDGGRDKERAHGGDDRDTMRDRGRDGRAYDRVDEFRERQKEQSSRSTGREREDDGRER
jgi:hypothetical protein